MAQAGLSWKHDAVALACGLALALGHAPFDLPYLALLAVPVLVRLLVRTAHPRRAARLGWWAGCGYFALTLTWIVEPFLIDIARHGWMAPFAMILMAGGLSLFWALGFGLARWAGGNRSLLRAALSLALSLTLAEDLRSHIFTGFPWALYAYTLIDTPLAQIAAFIGPHALGAVVLALLGLLALRHPAYPVAGVAGLAALWLVGAQRLGTEPGPDGPVLRLVQPNAAQHLKWQLEMMPVFYQRLIAATAAPADTPPAAVIWPETAVPFLLGDRPDLMADISQAAGVGTPVILGIRRLDQEFRWYNTLAVLSDGAVGASYDKSHLVPFGEYLPLAGLWDRIGLGAVAEGLVGSFTPGTGPARISLTGLPDFQPLICYEAIFPHEILRGQDRPGWLLQITNDAWFGTRSGPYQHLAQARMRAIEQGLPLARAANTGISAMIDPYGRVMASLPLGQDGYIDAPLPKALPATPYARTPDWLAALLMLAGLVGLSFRR